MKYSDYIIYVDESGSSNLSPIEKDYPVFVLNFCIFKKIHYNIFVTRKIQKFKFKHFGHDNVILHAHAIRNREEPFDFLQDAQNRTDFMNELSQLIETARFSIAATTIRKSHLKKQYSNPFDPYEIALLLCMERAYLFLKKKSQHNKTTHIILEKRNKKQNDKLERAFERIRDGKGVLNKIGPMPKFEIEFADKKVNSAGLQLADLTARPIGLYVINPKQSNRSWNIIKGKIIRGLNGRMKGHGLKVFP